MDSKHIIVALDFPDARSALAMAARLDPALCRVKVGKELFLAEGPGIVEQLQRRGFEVFLDLKFNDIPNTVASAVRVGARMGVWMLNVHASGGETMMRAAREALDGLARPPLLIAVTILTSLADADLARIGYSGTVAANVERLAALTKASGLDGVVCSAQEAAILRNTLGPAFVTVTPGIRLAGDAKGDQVRVVTPEDAIRMGSHYLVIGRPITQAADPVATLESICASLAGIEAAA